MDMNQLTGIFCQIDDFCKELNHYSKGKFLPSPTTRRGPACCLSDSEIMTILILFQSSRWRDFKNYYHHFLSTYYHAAFSTLPSYIETVINHFKHHYHIWHTRHRSPLNAVTHLMAGVAAYVIEPLKISAIKLLTSDNCLA